MKLQFNTSRLDALTDSKQQSHSWSLYETFSLLVTCRWDACQWRNPNDLFYNIKDSELLSAYNFGNVSTLKYMLDDQSKSTELKSKSFSLLRFTKPIYVNTIGFLCEDEAVFEVEYKDFYNTAKTIEIGSKNKDKRHVVFIRDFVSSVGVKVKRSGFFDKKKREISNLKITALTIERCSEIVKNYLAVKSDRDKFELLVSQHKESLQSVLDDIESKKQDFQLYIQSKDQEIEELDEQKEQLISEVEEQNQLLSNAKSQIADKNI